MTQKFTKSSTAASSSNPARKSEDVADYDHHDNDSDSSSGDEEVLEDSGVAGASGDGGGGGKLRDVKDGGRKEVTKPYIYRFSSCHAEAKRIVQSTLEARVGLTDGVVTSGGTWPLIATIKSFCHLSGVSHQYTCIVLAPNKSYFIIF